MTFRFPRTFHRGASVAAALVLLSALPAAGAEPPSPAPLWFAVWDLDAQQLIPLGRYADGRFTDPWPEPRIPNRLDGYEPCATGSTKIPAGWWGDGGTPPGPWVAHDLDGTDIRFRIGATAVLSCDASRHYWTPKTTPEPGFAWPTGRGGWLLATSSSLPVVPPVPIDERSREGKLVEARLRPTILRLERLWRAGIDRALATGAEPIPCSPDPQPLGDEPDLEWQIARSAVPLGGRTPIHAEAWARGAVGSAEERIAWGAPETFAAWLVACDGDTRTVSRRLRFTEQGCQPLDESLVSSTSPLGFFELDGRLFAFRMVVVTLSARLEILEIRDDSVAVVLSWLWSGGC